MDETQLAVTVVLCVCNIMLAVGLVVSLWRVSRLADKCINHALAESLNQREIMRLQFDTEHQEFLLREARTRAARMNGSYVPQQAPEPAPNPEILVDATGSRTID